MANLDQPLMRIRDLGASNPGRVRVHWPTAVRCYMVLPFSELLLFTSMGFLLASVRFPVLSLVGLVMAVVGFWRGRSLSAMCMASGDTCPAVVVNAQKNLIAVFANMSSRGSKAHAVKIMKAPLRWATGAPFDNGDRLAVACLFRGDPEESTWSSIWGMPVACVTSSHATIERTLRMVPEEEWNHLLGALEAVPRPYRPGLYFVAGSYGRWHPASR